MKKTLLRVISIALVAIMLLAVCGCDQILGGDKEEEKETWASMNDVASGNDYSSNGSNNSNQQSNQNNNNNSNQNNNNSNQNNNSEINNGDNNGGDNNGGENLMPGELDFDGAEVTVLYRDYIQNSREWYKETTEDVIDEAVATRNYFVEQNLNVKICWAPVASNGNDYTEYTARFHDMVVSDVNSGRHYYDISANFGYSTASNNIREFTTNLLDEDLFPYFDFSLPCWNQAIVNNTTINDQLYYVAGDVNLSVFDAACVIWHNKTLYDANKLDTDPENLQQHALNGNWTRDDLHRWTSAFYVDNGYVSDSRDGNDTYALLANSNDPMPRDAFAYAWDLEFVVENNDGTHTFNIVSNRKIETALFNARALLRAAGTYSTSNANMFASGRAIFFMEKLYAGKDQNMAIRQMDDTYALLPMPKYDTDQTKYYTTAQDYYTLMFVLDHSYSKVPTKGDEVSAFLQLSCETSYLGIRDYYFENVVMPKFSSTAENSKKIFDIIINGIRFDYCYVYSPQLNNINHLWRDALAPGLGATDTLEKMYLADKYDFETAVITTDRWFGLE